MPEKSGATKETPQENSRLIREHNDSLRLSLKGGEVTLTQGVQALGERMVSDIIKKVQAYNSFTPDNDPNGEHDFGVIEHNKIKIFWVIDYYDKSFLMESPDPSDPAVTARVLTIMIAGEC